MIRNKEEGTINLPVVVGRKLYILNAVARYLAQGRLCVAVQQPHGPEPRGVPFQVFGGLASLVPHALRAPYAPAIAASANRLHALAPAQAPHVANNRKQKITIKSLRGTHTHSILYLNLTGDNHQCFMHVNDEDNSEKEQ